MKIFGYVEPGEWINFRIKTPCSAWISRPSDKFYKWWAQQLLIQKCTGIISCRCPVNKRRHYNVTSSLIGWAHTQSDPWLYHNIHVIARPSMLPKAAHPMGGQFRYYVKKIHFTMQGFGFLSAILVRQNWKRATTTDGEVPPLFNLARFDLKKILLFVTIYKQRVWLFQPFDSQFLSTVFQLK